MGNVYLPIVMSWGTCTYLSWCHGERYVPIVVSWGTCVYLSWGHEERVFTYHDVMGVMSIYWSWCHGCNVYCLSWCLGERLFAYRDVMENVYLPCHGSRQSMGRHGNISNSWMALRGRPEVYGSDISVRFNLQFGFSNGARQSSALNQNRTRDPCSLRHSARNVFQKSAGSLCTETL